MEIDFEIAFSIFDTIKIVKDNNNNNNNNSEKIKVDDTKLKIDNTIITIDNN